MIKHLKGWEMFKKLVNGNLHVVNFAGTMVRWSTSEWKQIALKQGRCFQFAGHRMHNFIKNF